MIRASPAIAAALTLLQITAARADDPPPQPGTAADARATWSDPFDSDRSIRVITAEEIWRSNARNLPDLLRQEIGVWMTFANYAGGGPILGGVAGNDILILLDGIKLNNTAYRFGDLEYLSTIDLHMLERVEIVRGAAGPYAGDSVGPVIRLFSKRDAAPLSPGPEPPEDPVARAFYRYATVDKSSVAHVDAYQQNERYAFQFALTTRDIGDLKGGGDVGFQRITAYEEVAGNARVQYFLSDTRTFEIQAQILEQQNTTQYDRIEGGSHLAFDLDPRKRALFELSYLETTDRSWSDRLEARLYLHQQRQRALEQLAATPDLRQQTSDNNDVLGFLARAEVAVGTKHRLDYGLELYEEEVDAVRREIDVLTGEELVRGKDLRRDGQSRDQITVWIEDRIQVAPQLAVRLGARFSSFSVAGMQQTEAGLFDLNADDDGVAGYLSLIWSPRQDLRLFASYDHGFRLPGIDEITSHTTQQGLASLPNSDLVAETADTYEIGARYRNDWIEVAGALFRKELDDIALLLPASVGGSSFEDLDGDGVRDPGEPLWIRTQSAAEAEIDGIDLSIELSLPHDLTLFASFIATTGDEPRSGRPLTGIPPDYGAVGLRWEGGGRRAPWVEVVRRYGDDKTRLSPAERMDPALDPLSLASYDVLTWRAGVTLPPRLRLVVSLENPSDDAYKPYGSFLYAPARNLAVTAEYVF